MTQLYDTIQTFLWPEWYRGSGRRGDLDFHDERVRLITRFFDDLDRCLFGDSEEDLGLRIIDDAPHVELALKSLEADLTRKYDRAQELWLEAFEAGNLSNSEVAQLTESIGDYSYGLSQLITGGQVLSTAAGVSLKDVPQTHESNFCGEPCVRTKK